MLIQVLPHNPSKCSSLLIFLCVCANITLLVLSGYHLNHHSSTRVAVWLLVINITNFLYTAYVFSIYNTYHLITAVYAKKIFEKAVNRMTADFWLYLIFVISWMIYGLTIDNKPQRVEFLSTMLYAIFNVLVNMYYFFEMVGTMEVQQPHVITSYSSIV